MKKNFNLNIDNIHKSFTQKIPIFQDISFNIKNNNVVGITGHNGSGKTTLLRVLSGVLLPSKGKVELTVENNLVKKDDYYKYIGFVGPYLNIYEEFSPMENIKIFAEIRGKEFNSDKAIELLKMFNIYKRRNDHVKTFSSGMKQRVKYIINFLEDFEILLLDEPFTNLDSEGIGTLIDLINMHTLQGGGIIIASNDDREKALCKDFVNINITRN
jgi:heme exporter protein A